MEQIAIADPERPLTVKMPARKWNIVMHALNKHPLPFEIVAPVISDVSDQLRAQADPPPPLSTEEVEARTAAEPPTKEGQTDG
jgi:hypothetical protein